MIMCNTDWADAVVLSIFIIVAGSIILTLLTRRPKP